MTPNADPLREAAQNILDLWDNRKIEGNTVACNWFDSLRAALAADAPEGPTLADILSWLSAEGEWWVRGRRQESTEGRTRRYQTNLVWQRLVEWRDTGVEPKHGL